MDQNEIKNMEDNAFSDEELPLIEELAPDGRRTKEWDFFHEMEDNIVRSFSGTRSGEPDEVASLGMNEKLVEIAHSLSRDNSKSRSPCLSNESEYDDVSRQNYLEARFKRNTFDDGLFDPGRLSNVPTSRGEELLREIMSNRPRSAHTRFETSQVTIPVEEDMGHLSRRIYMRRDVSGGFDVDEPPVVQSYGVRDVLNKSSTRRITLDDLWGGRVKSVETEAANLPGGPVHVSPYMVSKFIATLIRGLMLGDSKHSRQRFASSSTADKNVSANLPASSYDLFYRPGYFDQSGDPNNGGSDQCTAASTSGKVSGKVDILAFNAALSRNDELPPELDEVVNFFYKICVGSQMEYECALISLIYIERVIDISRGVFNLNASNWKGLVLACMLLSSKVWDDFHIRNIDYTDIFFGLAIERVNALELRLLQVMCNDLWVSPSQYASVHFLIQEMFAKEEINRAEAERVCSVVRRSSKNGRRQKPTPVSSGRVPRRYTPPKLQSILSTQIHCIGTVESHHSSGDADNSTCTISPPRKEKQGLVAIGESLRRLYFWAFAHRCGCIDDVHNPTDWSKRS